MFGFIRRKKLDTLIKAEVAKQSQGFITELSSTPDKTRDKETDEQVLYRLYEETSWVRACVDVIQRSVTSRGFDIIPAPEVDDPDQEARKRLVEFFGDCNPQETIQDLIADCTRDLLVLHNSYWEIKRKENGEPEQLWSLDPVWMKVQADDHGIITGYVQEVNGQKKVEFTPDEVLHWKIGARGSNVYGVPALTALITPLEVDLFAQTYNRAFFKKGAKVRGAICIDNATPEQIERNHAYLQKIADKPEEARGDLLLEGKMQYVKIGTDPKDMEFFQLRTFVRDEVLAVFGCPPAKVSLIETGNIGAGSGDSQDRNLYEETVIPLQNKIAHRINKVIIREGFGIKDWVFAFRPRVINQKQQAEVDDIYVNNGVLTKQEVRARLGLRPQDSTEPDTPPDDTDDLEDADPNSVKKNSLKKNLDVVDVGLTRHPKINVAESKALDELELHFEETVIRFFDDLTAQIVKDVARISRQNVQTKMLGTTFERRFTYKSFHLYDFEQYKFPVVVKQLKDFDEVSDTIFNANFEEMFEEEMFAAADKGGKLARDRLKRSLPKGVADKLGGYVASSVVIEAIQAYASDLSTFLKRTLDDQVKLELLEGITAGEETTLLTRRIKNAMKNPAPVKVQQPFKDANGNWSRKTIFRKVPKVQRARTIARTETTRFMTEGALDSMEQSGVVKRVEFIAAEDHCPLCEPYAGKVFSMDNARGFIPVHHNCRCTFAPVVNTEPLGQDGDEKEPAFVPLNRNQAEQLSGDVLRTAVPAEQNLTPALQKIAGNNDATMKGLDFRLKEKKSLMRKIQKESAENGWNAADILDQDMNDAVRYTMVLEEQTYAQNAKNIIAQMKAQGFEEVPNKIKNYWRTADYRGINGVFRHPSGQKFELQLHTPKSLAAKDPSHALYEKSRLLTTTKAEKAALEKQMNDIWKKVPTPDGVDDIGILTRPSPTDGFVRAQADDFIATLEANIDPTYDAFVTRYTAKEYQDKGVKLFLSRDGRSGYGVAKDGDIISVFSQRKSSQGPWAVRAAVHHGGTKLDAFGEFLPNFYKKHGFKEVNRIKWDDKYAPSNWNYKKFDRPDVVFMELERKPI